MANKRQDIVDALQEIIVKTMAFKTVAIWKTGEYAPALCPICSVRDTIDAFEPSRYNLHRHNLTVELQIVAVSATSASDARELANTAMQAIGSDATLSGLVEKIVVTRVDLGVDEAGKQVAVLTITLNIIHETSIYSL